MSRNIRMIPPKGVPDPQRLVPLVRDHVKKKLGRCQEEQLIPPPQSTAASVVYLPSAAPPQGEHSPSEG